MTNDSGEYELTNIPYGKHLVEVKTLEATPEPRQIVVNRPHIELEIVVKDNSSYNLEEVIVWGKNEAQKLKEKGFAVNVIETAKLGLQSLQMNELLNRSAGVRIRESGGMGSAVNYNINGLSGNSVRIFVDGIPIRNYGASFSLSNIPASQIERVEVFKGVVPAHLSEDALGGAINVILKKTDEARKSLSASYSYGSFNSHQGSLDGSYRDSGTGFTVSGSAFYNYTDNNYKVWGNQVYVDDPVNNWERKYIKTKRFHDSYESYGIRGNIGFTNVKWADNLLLGILVSDMNKDVQHGATMNTVFGNRRTGQSTRMASLRYEKRNLFIKNLDARVFASYTNSERWVVDTIPYKYNWLGNKSWNEDAQDYYTWNNGGGEQGKATLAENKEKTIAGRANLVYNFHPQHRLSVNYLLNRFTRDVEDPLLATAEQELTETRYLTKHIIGTTYENHFFDERLKSSIFFKHYIQNVRLKDPLKSNNEITFVEYDKTVSHNGYGISASFAAWPKILLRASYEKALRMPESNELLGNTSDYINASYDLEPEKSNNINLGVVLGTFGFGRHELLGDVNFFIRDIKNMIERGEIKGDNTTVAFENLGKVMSRGFDAEVGYNYARKLFVTLNMSLFNARFNLQYGKDGKPIAYYKDRLRNSPYLTANAHAEYVFSNLLGKNSQLSLNYNFGYVHEFYYTWESRGGAGKPTIPAQYVHDLGILYKAPASKWAFSIDIKNLLDEQVFDNYALQKPGRAIYAKITYKIF